MSDDDETTEHDDLADYVARREQREPGFARMVEEETQRLLREQESADSGNDGGIAHG